MKILILFCDMLRANRLKTVNKDIPYQSSFDKWIRDFGGCTYTNCYTPAPDTPRSLACFYTGLYPKQNGCKTRLEWPKYFQNSENPTIFKLLHNSKYDTFTNFSSNELKTGVLNNNDLELITNFKSFQEFYNSKVIDKRDKNSCYFLTLNDYHQCVEDYSSLKRADKKGQEQLIESFELFFKKYDKDLFDYIFIFSDHGCVLSDDYSRFKKNYFLLDDNRSQIFMHLRKKGDKSACKDHSLRTVMDIYPSIAEIINSPAPENLNGISLFDSNPHKFIVVEDASSFKPSLGMFNDIWRYKEKDFSYYLSIYDGEELKYENSEKAMNSQKVNIKKITEIVSEVSCSYEEISKRNGILKSYAELKKEYSIMCFSSGKKRNNYLKIYSYKIFSLFIKVIQKLYFNIFKFF